VAYDGHVSIELDVRRRTTNVQSAATMTEVDIRLLLQRREVHATAACLEWTLTLATTTAIHFTHEDNNQHQGSGYDDDDEKGDASLVSGRIVCYVCNYQTMLQHINVMISNRLAATHQV